ncbi:MAG: hypothetical protein U1E42_16085 [Rhodospirillales bacterium]
MTRLFAASRRTVTCRTADPRLPDYGVASDGLHPISSPSGSSRSISSPSGSPPMGER